MLEQAKAGEKDVIMSDPRRVPASLALGAPVRFCASALVSPELCFSLFVCMCVCCVVCACSWFDVRTTSLLTLCGVGCCGTGIAVRVSKPDWVVLLPSMSATGSFGGGSGGSMTSSLLATQRSQLSQPQPQPLPAVSSAAVAAATQRVSEMKGQVVNIGTLLLL